MKQPELDFKYESPTDNYYSVTIDEGGNQAFKWLDTTATWPYLNMTNLVSIIQVQLPFEIESGVGAGGAS